MSNNPVTIFVSTLVLLALTVGFGWLGLQEPALRWRLSRGGVQATAIVVDVESVRVRRTTRLEPVVEFRLPTGKLHRGRMDSARPIAEFRRGQRVAVRYEPAPPHAVRAVEDLRGSYKTIDYLLMGGALMFLVLSLIGAVRLFRLTR